MLRSRRPSAILRSTVMFLPLYNVPSANEMKRFSTRSEYVTPDTLSRGWLPMVRTESPFANEMKRLPELSLQLAFPRETTAAKAERARTAADAQEAAPQSHDSPTRRREHDLRPQGDRQTAYSPSGLRLHRRSCRGGVVVDSGASGVRGHRVPPGDPARR